MDILSNTTVVILTIIFIVTLLSIIYLLLEQKNFNIKNVDIELNDFLNELYKASTKSNKETLKVTEKFIEEIQKYEDMNNQTKNSLNAVVSKIANELEGMKEHISSIQELSLEKEEKIRRYESGYDYTRIKSFTKGLFRILEDIKEAKNDDSNSVLSEIEEDILILLENNGIEKTAIEIGSLYKDNIKLAKVVGTVNTNLEEENGIVKEIVKDGYHTVLGENLTKTIIPTEVIIYKLNTGV